MANKVDPEMVRIAAGWKSLAYETYTRGFEQAISRHLVDLPGTRGLVNVADGVAGDPIG